MASAKYGDSQIILTSWGALGGLGRASGRGSSRVATFPQLFLSNPARLTDRPESYTSLDLCRTLFIKSYPDSALFMIFNNSSFVINSPSTQRYLTARRTQRLPCLRRAA